MCFWIFKKKPKIIDIFTLKDNDCKFKNLIKLYNYIDKTKNESKAFIESGLNHLPPPRILTDADTIFMVWGNEDNHFQVFYKDNKLLHSYKRYNGSSGAGSFPTSIDIYHFIISQSI